MKTQKLLHECSQNDELTKYGTSTVKYYILKVIHTTIWVCLENIKPQPQSEKTGTKDPK